MDGREAGEAELQDTMLRLFPLLAGVCTAGGKHASASLATLSAAMRHLRPAEWLPTLRSCLDIASLLQAAFGALASPPDPGELAFPLSSSVCNPRFRSWPSCCLDMCLVQ